MMQKDYQYRILICDRDDFAVLEMLEGRMIFPDVQSLEQFQQAQKDGGMEMIRNEGGNEADSDEME